MRYESTRGGAGSASSLEALLSGLAPDGGLYAPSEFPRLDMGALGAGSYAEAAAAVPGALKFLLETGKQA